MCSKNNCVFFGNYADPYPQRGTRPYNAHPRLGTGSGIEKTERVLVLFSTIFMALAVITFTLQRERTRLGRNPIDREGIGRRAVGGKGLGRRPIY